MVSERGNSSAMCAHSEWCWTPKSVCILNTSVWPSFDLRHTLNCETVLEPKRHSLNWCSKPFLVVACTRLKHRRDIWLSKICYHKLLVQVQLYICTNLRLCLRSLLSPRRSLLRLSLSLLLLFLSLLRLREEDRRWWRFSLSRSAAGLDILLT